MLLYRERVYINESYKSKLVLNKSGIAFNELYKALKKSSIFLTSEEKEVISKYTELNDELLNLSQFYINFQEQLKVLLSYREKFSMVFE